MWTESRSANSRPIRMCHHYNRPIDCRRAVEHNNRFGTNVAAIVPPPDERGSNNTVVGSLDRIGAKEAPAGSVQDRGRCSRSWGATRRISLEPFAAYLA